MAYIALNCRALHKPSRDRANVIPAGAIIANRYRVIRKIGGGGMKLVYQAEDLHLANRQCALAEMAGNFANHAQRRQLTAAFQREADLLAKLDNPHIPRVYDRFSDGTRHFLVMELVAGITLEQRMLEAGGKLPETEALAIALQLASVLEYLHKQTPAILHRDIKPSNTILTPTGLVKLIDFGIARYYRAGSNATVVGTPGYAAPEQYKGEPETASDVYALSALLHHMVSGRDPSLEPPFGFPALDSIAPQCNPLLARLVTRGLEYDVAKRNRSIADFKTTLLAIKTEGCSSARNSAGISSGVCLQGAATRRSTESLTSDARPVSGAPDAWSAVLCAKVYSQFCD